jgi:hypothetical protein
MNYINIEILGLFGMFGSLSIKILNDCIIGSFLALLFS